MKSQNVTVNNSYFKGNKAQNGGAIYFKDIQQTINFKTCQFEQNTALSSGGALYFENIPSCKVIFDLDTNIINNRALIGGGLRIVQTDENQIQLPYGFPFIHNVYQNLADIYGNDSTSYLQNIILSNNNQQNSYFFTFYENQTNILPKELEQSFSRLAEIKEFRSGGFIYFKVYIIDNQNRYLSFSKEMLVNSEYPIEIESELKSIQVSIYGLQSNQSLINGQQIINYYQYNSQSLAFEFSDLQIIGSSNELFFSVNSTIYTSSIVKQPILLSISFRNCIAGEVIQHINDQIYQCNQCQEGTYQINDPLQLYNDSIKGRSDVNRCINCPQSAIKCEGNKISLKNGFWRKSNYTDEIIECDPIVNSCQAQNPLNINYCSTGYLGPICGQCDILGEIWKGSRYSESISKGVCQICGPKLNQWIYLVLKIIFFEAYFLNVLDIFIKKFNYTQTCYYLRKLKVIPISSNSIQDYSGFYIKIILNYYQISSILIQQPKVISINFNFLSEIFGSGDRQLQLGIDCLISEVNFKQVSFKAYIKWKLVYKIGNQIGVMGALNLGSGLAKCINLSNLALELCFNKIGAMGASGLGSVLANCINLSHLSLDLRCSQIGDKGASCIGFGLANCINLSNLTLELINNQISGMGILYLDSGLANCINLSNLTLDLRRNQTSHLGASCLGRGLANYNNLSNLTLKLKLNQIDYQGTSVLGSALANCTNLSNLTLDLRNSQIDAISASNLVSALANCSNLSNLTLYLSNNQIDAIGTSGLGSALSNCSNLSNLALYLGLNQIGNQGTSALGSALANCTNLSNLTLDLRLNQIGAMGASDLGSGLGNCINLSNLTLYLYNNLISAIGASGLGSGLANCTNLSNLALDLSYNQIGDQGALGLSSALANCTNLSKLTLYLQLNQIGVIGASDLGSALANCINLSNLELYLQQVSAEKR
ncbi:transmembrane protein, putative (macronuclear) [Tetrahymena thermophila SB210]|uniref:Transmembrane protein, putative n=1 Tax=Tetrahymena thermophila (strain SB210) TaxID=312017 RepID=Q239T5_TETTS|nr:transmembrane protein, putative [Tetrahymena thermophila SB210]EAR93323.2 transmembrane protein, putative [Tetrahymena thermophila SB210]|eukprot:XP_001013568.2 transmembrane protein, putative [Tetrahymena thermophila SB210]